MRAIGALLLCLLMCGCVVSVQPVVSPASATFDARLVGRWAEVDGKDRIVVSRGDANTYEIQYTDGDGKVGHFEGQLGRLGQRTVLDVQPSARESSPMPEGPSLIRGHIIYVVAIAADSVRMQLLNPKALRAAIKNKSAALGRRRAGSPSTQAAMSSRRSGSEMSRSQPGAMGREESAVRS